MSPDDVEDFASWVKLRLIDGDYAVIRKFQGRCSPATYLTVVIRRLYFVAQMTVAEIARSLHVEQKPLYRNFQSIFDRLRKELESAGIAAADAADIIGRADSPLLDVGLRNMGNPSARTSSISGSGTGNEQGSP